MRSAPADLDQFLEDLARDAQPGERLPTIRELMRRFGVSQMIVQRAVSNLKARGLIAAEVGRGTYFRGGDVRGNAEGATPAVPAAPRTPAVRSVLLLRRSISIARGRVLVESLQRRFAADGHRVLEVSYTDPDHARAVLRGLPRFDACVIQSTYKPITIELLAALREKSEVLAVDGMALMGTDVEAVGTEWGEPLSEAVALLAERGHRRIAFAATSQPLLATQLGLRRFEHLRATATDLQLELLSVPHLPDDQYESALAAMIAASKDGAGRLPFTALVAWGVENGAKFRALLSEIGTEVPRDLSVVLLGRTDLSNEHAEFFHTIGCSVEDQADALQRAVAARWADPSSPYGVRLIPVDRRPGASVSVPARSKP
jgi:DNA-binding LacI/PurR family transcriptional regulator